MEYSYFEVLPPCAGNSYLAGYIISESIVQTLIYCLTLCLLNDDCRSVNAWETPGQGRNVTCQLNWSIGVWCSDLDTAPGVCYFAVRVASCEGMKRLVLSAQDGEYNLQFGRISAKVFCHNMSTDKPLVSPA